MRFARLGAIVSATALPLLAPGAAAQQPVDSVVAAGLFYPVDLAFPRSDRLYVAERRGVVRVVDHGVLLPGWLIDLREEVGNWGDHGLLGMALDPDFAANGHLYLAYVVDRHHLLHHGTGSYSATTNEYHDATIVRVARYTCDPATDQLTVLPASRLVLLGESAATGPAITATTHGACSLLFGRDGTLLVGVGDGTGGYLDQGSAPASYYRQALTDGILTAATNVGALRAQQIDSLNGKILRLDPATGDGVPGNPFFEPSQPRSARSRVFALGFRNPCRMALRPATGSPDRTLGQPGELWVGDVGWTSREELDVVTDAGQNFGWPLFEGMTTQSRYAGTPIDNTFAANPLAGGSCAPFFRFQDLLLDDTGNVPFFGNPCSPTVPIAPATPTSWHRLPLLDWSHAAADARVAVRGGGTLTFPQVGSAASGVSGVPFQGECSIGGTWHSGITFPPGFGAAYYHADFVAGWIRRLTIDARGAITAVAPLATVSAPVRLAEGPDHDLYYITYAPGHAVRRLRFGIDPPPVAVLATSATFGPGPLAIDVDARASYDVADQPVQTKWVVDDASQSTAAQSRLVVAGGTQPERHHVRLVVEDAAGQTSEVDVPVSLNASPPRIESLGVENGALYPTAAPAVVPLHATVSGGAGKLTWSWRTIHHHGAQEHPGPEDPHPTTTTTLAPTPDDGDFHAYSVTLTVTDALGFAATRRAWLFPDRPSAPVAVVLAQPLAGDAVVAGASTTLGALTSGPVQRVEFRVDGRLVGVATTPPYEVQWTASGDGPAVASALAIATDGWAASSRGTEFVVQAPTRSWTRLADVADDGREDLSTAPGPLLLEGDLLLGDDGGPQVTGLRFPGVTAPPGAQVVAAHVDFTAAATDTGVAWLLVGCEASAAPLPFAPAPGDLALRAPGAVLPWSPPAWAGGDTASAQRTPDLSALLHPLVADPAWNGDLTVLIYGFGGRRRAFAVDGLAAQAPLLCIDWLPPTPSPWSVLTSAGTDDANEVIASGGVDVAAPVLVLGGAPGAERIAGMRFQLPVPNGAVIDSARLRFTAAAADSDPAVLHVRVQEADDAPTFSMTTLDLSSRQLGAAAVVWTPGAWEPGHSGPAQRSPELRALLQAIVDRPGWTAGNGCVVLVQGSGTRSAEAQDAGPRRAPRLEILFH